MKLTTMIQASAAVLVLTLTSPAAVLAADIKVYPGSWCKRIVTGQPNKSDFTVLSSKGGIFNFSGSTTRFRCPAVRDIGGSISGTVVALDNIAGNGNGKEVMCILKTFSQSGGTVATQIRKTSGNSSSPQTLNFSTMSAASNGLIVYDCDLPSTTSAEIISYRVKEN